MFDVPGSDIVDVIITDDVVNQKDTPQYIHRPEDVTPEEEDVWAEEAQTKEASAGV